VASRFVDLQTQLNQAIMSLAQTRIGALGAHQQATTGMIMNTQSNVMNVGLAGLNAQLTARGQDIGQDQFNRQLAQNQRQFDATIGQRNVELAQDQRQFDATMGFNRDQMAQQNQQFFDRLNMENRQFYAQLSQSRQLAYAQMAASQGPAAAAAQLDRDRLNWQMQTYDQERQDALNNQEMINTQTQVGNAMAVGGFVENSIKRLIAGETTVGQIQNYLQNAGYTANAQQVILDQILANPNVQRVISRNQQATTGTAGGIGGVGRMTPTGGRENFQGMRWGPAGEWLLNRPPTGGLNQATERFRERFRK